MLGSCVAGPLLHTPAVDTNIEAFRTRGTPIAMTENTRSLLWAARNEGRLTRNPPTGAGRRRLFTPAAASNTSRTSGIGGTGSPASAPSGVDGHRQLQIADYRLCLDCWYNVDSVYSAGAAPSDEGNILTADNFRAICEWEDHLAETIDYAAHCAKVGGECCPPQSLPRMLSATLGVPCASLTDEVLQSAVLLLTQASITNGVDPDFVQGQFLDDTFTLDGADGLPSAWLTRSLLCLDLRSYGDSDNYREQRKVMGAQLLPLYQGESGLAAQVPTPGNI